MEITNKYQNGKIYMIWTTLGDEKYYGSTIRKLSMRMASHRNNYKTGLNVSSCFLFDKYGIENCKIELVINYPCNSKEELIKKEGEYIRNNDCINKRIAGRIDKEYYEDNKELLQQKHKKHYEDNKELILQKHKEYREKEDNKKKMKEYQKIYYETNKQKIKQKNLK
jgi:hypothetical protein